MTMWKHLSEDLTWLSMLIGRHVPCSCYTWRLWRSCAGKPWCLRQTHFQRLGNMATAIKYECAVNIAHRKKSERPS